MIEAGEIYGKKRIVIKLKRIISGILALAFMSTILSGCGNKQTPAEKLAAAAEKTNQAQSVNSKLNMDFGVGVSASGMNMNLDMKMNFDCTSFKDPQKTKADGTLDLGIYGKQTMQIYSEKKDNQMLVYSNTGSGWTTASADTMNQVDPSKELELFTEVAENFKEAGTEKINDQDAIKITGTISGENLKKIFDSNELLQEIKSIAGDDQEKLEQLYNNLGSISVNFWIDSKTGYLVKTQMDITDVLKNLFSQAMTQSGTPSGVGFDVSTANIEISFSNFDQAEDFTIPDEARTSANVNSSTSSALAA